MAASPTDTTVSPDVAAEWIERWDRQQEGFIPHREERFAVITDSVTAALSDIDAPVIVDLGCGPGSLTARLARSLPTATLIGIDAEPLLLGLARAHYGEIATWVQTDLGDPAWVNVLPDTIHGAVSTTALHWMHRDSLAALYSSLAKRTVPGGVFVNADHMPLPDEQLQDLSTSVYAGQCRRAGVADREGYHEWWDAILADERLAPITGARPHPEADSADGAEHHHGSNLVTAAEHARLLQESGYTSAGPVWQAADDFVVAALR
ncbi:class I SAM-dependent methyltransferase [Lipingzhangella sp. LS1_29]|uniref:Class I SAM-dependent methyltransferase n=1 Tax=Lipingzhangella rawalii TaxID=2055835 RepID=A0ABU2H961_9ACTN|nr:class I SAM-dependent methyltransferase [Lipingzhangella rawalii]MDS1271842.1 class I SAM-dependent methyltransferase [Lipingzhangella rawalii]